MQETERNPRWPTPTSLLNTGTAARAVGCVIGGLARRGARYLARANGHHVATRANLAAPNSLAIQTTAGSPRLISLKLSHCAEPRTTTRAMGFRCRPVNTATAATQGQVTFAAHARAAVGSGVAPSKVGACQGCIVGRRQYGGGHGARDWGRNRGWNGGRYWARNRGGDEGRHGV